MAAVTHGESWVRWNQQGYAPAQRKEVLVMSEEDLEGRVWTLSHQEGPGSHGRIPASEVGANDHSPMPFHHRIDLTATTLVGEHVLAISGVEDAVIRVQIRPYAELANLPLRHLRMQRSGTDTVWGREASHFGDVRAQVSIPDGDPDQGAWKPAEPARFVDVQGGWYDAGDHLKFTLTTAYTVYHLLEAYEVAPEVFTRDHSSTPLPDILDEAKHGLAYLVKLMPDEDTFIIQVGNSADHNEGWRLPADDRLDGVRPAMAAWSRVHLASAAAALAKGARVLGVRSDQKRDAEHFAATALRMFRRAQSPETIQTAFERDVVNDFYRDNSVEDQMALAAYELTRLTGRPESYGQESDLRPGRSNQVGWANWHWLANRGLAAQGDAQAAEDLRREVTGYEAHGREQGQPWGIPSRYGWGSLTRWVGAANAAQAAKAMDASTSPLFADMLDYVFGRNPWGVSFLCDERLPNTLRHLYIPTAVLMDRFPTGAFSAGPARRGMHEEMRRYFDIPTDNTFERFNTAAMVFYDYEHDFVCQEATIGGQADIILMLALAAAESGSL